MNANLGPHYTEEMEAEYLAEQDALPPHKRDGYAEQRYEAADDLRLRIKEEWLFSGEKK